MKEEFINEMKALFEKYQVRIIGFDDYDGNEEYCGTNHYFYSRCGEINIPIEEDLFNE